jgi:hypothetical protein
MVKQQVESSANGKIRCDACPVMCYIADGRSGACDRYANVGGDLIRVDPLTIIEHTIAEGGNVVPFLPTAESAEWDGDLVHSTKRFVTAVGAGTTYPDYKPAPFIVSQKENGIDMVTVVTEGIFSYCGAKVKIDTDRFLGPETSAVRVDGEVIGHVTTGEYGSQMLSLGGVHHLTGGSKKEGRVTCEALLQLCNGAAVDMQIDGGVNLKVQAGKAPIINDAEETRMRVGCGSATIGMFAKQWMGHVDEVVVVDDHITGVLSEHQAGKLLDVPATGIRIKGRRSTPGRYFQVAEPGIGWGGTNIADPLTILSEFDPKTAWPGMRMLMVSTTGEQYAYYVLERRSAAGAADDPAGGAAGIGRDHCRELRTGPEFRHVHRRRRRQPAGGRHHQSGAPDAVRQRRADLCFLRRRARLCLAGRWYHRHGRCDADAEQLVRLCADPCPCRADRVHHAHG